MTTLIKEQLSDLILTSDNDDIIEILEIICEYYSPDEPSLNLDEDGIKDALNIAIKKILNRTGN